MATVTEPDPTDDAATGAATEVPAGSLAWLTWRHLLVLLAAVAWLAGALTWAWTEWSDRPPGAGSVDVGFLQDMGSHHEQAVEMALLQLANGEDPTATTFAKEILAWQSFELGLMDAQLADWGHSRAERSDTAMAWMGMATPVEAMPGMASPDELAALGAASGAEADELFLQLMTRHHAGGVHMGDHAVEHAEHAEVQALAARFSRNQAIEITEFAHLAERLGVELDPGSVALGQDPFAESG